MIHEKAVQIDYLDKVFQENDSTAENKVKSENADEDNEDD